MKNLPVLLAVVLASNVAGAEVPEFLNHFERNPKAATGELPKKVGFARQPMFSPAAIVKRDFVRIKDEFRKNRLCTASLPGQSCAIKNAFVPSEESSDDYSLKAFLGGNYESNLQKLVGLEEGATGIIPWSGSYWPIYQGGIAARYGDPKFPASETFKVNYRYFIAKYLKMPKNDPHELAQLSPAEKYDYLLGDNSWGLTKSVWLEGKSYQDSAGKVETWMGICHGWAPAAFMVPEPKRAFDVQLPSARGTLRLFPHDVKALVSQLWAQANFPVQFLGGRCNDKHPKEDENGRIISKDCFDINPSTWHITLLHKVGRDHQSFVLDATYDYEVWNQPISSYKIEYFSPITKEIKGVNDSVVLYSDVKNDPYKSYRSPKVKYLLGVKSKIKYVVEEDPYQADSVSNPLNRLETVEYFYDLELDENYNLIGGEWYQQAHPDMLWRPQDRVMVAATGEEDLPVWEGRFPVPEELLEFGIYSSSQKMPLARIVDKLVEWASGR